MRGTSLMAAIVAIGASALAVGCGQQSAGSGGTAGVPAQARCVTPKLAPPGRTFTITDKDNGKSFCIVAGTGVFVYLHGTPTHMWAQISPGSVAVQPRASGRMILMRGVTGGYFVAMRPGHATLTSSRSPCQVRMGSAMPESMHCTAHSYFRVTLVIRGKA